MHMITSLPGLTEEGVLARCTWILPVPPLSCCSLFRQLRPIPAQAFQVVPWNNWIGSSCSAASARPSKTWSIDQLWLARSIKAPACVLPVSSLAPLQSTAAWRVSTTPCCGRRSHSTTRLARTHPLESKHSTNTFLSRPCAYRGLSHAAEERWAGATASPSPRWVLLLLLSPWPFRPSSW